MMDEWPAEHIARLLTLQRFLEAAEAAHVPWSYQQSLRLTSDRGYRKWIAHAVVCRTLSVDPSNPPAVLGTRPPKPGNLDPRMVERDIAALRDFSCRPLHDFAEREWRSAAE